MDLRPNGLRRRSTHAQEPLLRRLRSSRFCRAFDAGTPAEELARRNGIHANTIRLWRSKYAGMSVERSSALKAA